MRFILKVCLLQTFDLQMSLLGRDIQAPIAAHMSYYTSIVENESLIVHGPFSFTKFQGEVGRRAGKENQ